MKAIYLLFLLFVFPTLVNLQALSVVAQWIGSTSYQAATVSVADSSGTVTVQYQTAYS